VETASLLVAAQQGRGGTLSRIAVERLDAVGGHHAFRPAMAVTQWMAVKPC
jgi:precorrin-6B C5,15-methyltransferase / cobalt-precorrin-6B C5,C15-methyltransferase